MSRSLRFLLLLGVAIAVASGWFSRGGGGSTDYAPRPDGYSDSSQRPAPDSAQRPGVSSATTATRNAGLPLEALATLDAIRRGGPFQYDRDGVVFQNRERRLPERPRGYYREYTVTTPGSRDRGARRIITGGEPPQVFYYSDDHYQTFRRLEASR